MSDLWLEEVEGSQALEWVKTVNQTTQQRFENNPDYQSMKAEALELLNDAERIPGVILYDDFAYNLWTDDTNKRGLWRRQSIEDYLNKAENWEILLDVDALAAEEQASWVFHGPTFGPHGTERCLISLSPGGKDASERREFCLKTKTFVADGFTVPESKTTVTWQDLDTLIIGTTLTPDEQTDSSYACTIKRWQRGTQLADAPIIQTTVKTNMSLNAGTLEHGDQRFNFITEAIDFYHFNFYLNRDGQFQRINLPEKATLSGLFQNRLLFQIKAPLELTNETIASGSLLSLAVDDAFAENPSYDVIFANQHTQILESLAITNDFLYIHFLQDVCSRLSQFSLDAAQTWQNQPIELPSPHGTVTLGATEKRQNLALFYYEDYLSPTALLALAGTQPPRQIYSLTPKFDPTAYQVTQHFATSNDGTQIPYFMIASKDLELNGQNTTLQYGYGGFEITLQPRYAALMERLWLKKNTVYVLANIRGGGEYGPDWHQSVLKTNRLKAYQDFAAVSQDLFNRQVTCKEKLGIMGGSNGGLLMGTMATRYPKLYSAVVCQVPLLDMIRYHKLLAGASWMAEYGNPEVQPEYDYLMQYSPYQNVHAEQNYPPVIFMTSTRDDRVHPGHARRMFHKMQDLGYDVDYYENLEGGHGGAADSEQRAHWQALQYSWLLEKIR